MSPAAPAPMPITLTEATTSARRGRELEEGRSVQRARLRRATLLRLLDRLGRRQRRHVLAVLDDRAQLRARSAASSSGSVLAPRTRLRPWSFAAVDGEVGLVDQLVRVEAVLREARDADRHGRADRLGRRLDLELALGDRAADPLRDLERLLRRGLRQENRELLAAEARRHVVVPELRRGRSRRSPSAPRRRRGGRSCC